MPLVLSECVLPVRFNVAELLKSTAGVSEAHDVNEDIASIDKDLDIVELLTGKVRLMRTSTGILVTGHLCTKVRMPCRRCGVPVSVPVGLDLEEEFRPFVDIFTGAVIPVSDDEDEATRTDEHHVLDITEVVRQNLWLAMPMSPLCSPQCQGLCPSCGANLNNGPCGCQHEDGDPRLAALRELL